MKRHFKIVLKFLISRFRKKNQQEFQGIASEEDLLLKLMIDLSKINSFVIVPSEAKKIIKQYKNELTNNSFFNWEKNLPLISKHFNLKLNRITESFNNIQEIVSDQTPILFFKKEIETAIPKIYLLLSYKNNKFTILEINSNNKFVISAMDLPSFLGVSNLNVTTTFFTCLPDYGYQPKNKNLDSKKDSYNAFQQILYLAKLEYKDIWVIVIYGIGIGILSLVIPIATSSLVNVVTFGVMLQPIFILTLLVIFFMSFAGAMQIFQTIVMEILQRRILVRISLDFANKFPKMTSESLDFHYKPELGNRFFDTFTIQKSINSLLVEGLSVVLTALIGFVLIAIYHPIFIVFDFFILIIGGYIIIYKFGKKASKEYMKVSKQKYKLAAWIEEIARHSFLFHGNRASDFAYEKTDILVKDYLSYRDSYFKNYIKQVFGLVSIQVISNGILLGIGGYLVIERQLTIGQLVAAELVISKVLYDITKFGKHLESYYSLLAAVEKIDKVLSLPLLPVHPNPFIPSHRPMEVEFSELEYTDHYANVFFTDLSFNIPSGSATGIITSLLGSKNILFELMTGSRIPTQGMIFLDRQDIFKTDFFENHNHTFLLRGKEIFEGEIIENIQLGSVDISQIDIRECLEKLNLWKIILSLPDGLFTKIATFGFPLDSTSLILLQIARVVLAKPRLIIIDGTLDDLPKESIQSVLDLLLEKSRPWTLIIYSKSNYILSRMDSIMELNENGLDIIKGKRKLQTLL